MATIDITQNRHKRKTPIVRTWVHPKKGGDDYWYEYRNLKAARMGRTVHSKEGYVESPLVAYGGREYLLKEFQRKHPAKFQKLAGVKKKRRTIRSPRQMSDFIA